MTQPRDLMHAADIFHSMRISLPPTFWQYFCAFSPIWVFLYIVTVVLLLLMFYSLAFIDRGSASFVILLVNLVVGGFIIIVLTVMLRRCSRYT